MGSKGLTVAGDLTTLPEVDSELSTCHVREQFRQVAAVDCRIFIIGAYW